MLRVRSSRCQGETNRVIAYPHRIPLDGLKSPTAKRWHQLELYLWTLRNRAEGRR